MHKREIISIPGFPFFIPSLEEESVVLRITYRRVTDQFKKKKKEKRKNTGSCTSVERSSRLGASPSFAIDWTSHRLSLSPFKCKINGLSGVMQGSILSDPDWLLLRICRDCLSYSTREKKPDNLINHKSS